MAQPAERAGGNDGNPDVNAGGFLPDCHSLMGAGHGIRLPARCDLDGSPVMDHGSVPNTGLCATDSTSAPVRLAFGPMLVHRRTTLSALAPQCVETEPPGHHGDSRAVGVRVTPDG